MYVYIKDNSCNITLLKRRKKVYDNRLFLPVVFYRNIGDAGTMR